MAKRAVNLQEFVAHAGPVNCLAIGSKTGSVLATGGDDRKVAIWAIGQPNALWVRLCVQWVGDRMEASLSCMPVLVFGLAVF